MRQSAIRVQVRQEAVAKGIIADAEVDAVLKRLGEPDFAVFAPVMFTAWRLTTLLQLIHRTGSAGFISRSGSRSPLRGVRTIQNRMTLAAGILGSTLGLLGLLLGSYAANRYSKLDLQTRPSISLTSPVH